MKTSPAGIALVKQYEMCVLRAYPDPASPLGVALQARGLWQRVLHGLASIPQSLAQLSGAPWTCGWGATGDGIGPGTVWTQQQADTRLAVDVALREAIVSKAVTVPLTQGQFDAMVSIVFNVGHGSSEKDGIIVLKNGKPSTLLRKLNAGDYDGCADQFLLWISPGSNVEDGLKRRRTQERMLFLTGAA